MLHQKPCITFYMNTIHKLCESDLYLDSCWSLLYFKFDSVFKICQNFGGLTILKDAPCVHGTTVFAMKFRKSLWKLLSKQEIIKLLNRINTGKRQKEIMKNMWGLLPCLKYGRNENMTFCSLIGHERHELFWGIFNFIMGVSPSHFVVVTLLLTKGLFLTSTTQTLPILMAEIAVLMDFYIRLQASSRISMRNRFLNDVWI